MSIRNDYDGYGRTSMLNSHLKIYDGEGQLVEERVIETLPDFEDALRLHFGVVR